LVALRRGWVRRSKRARSDERKSLADDHKPPFSIDCSALSQQLRENVSKSPLRSPLKSPERRSRGSRRCSQLALARSAPITHAGTPEVGPLNRRISARTILANPPRLPAPKEDWPSFCWPDLVADAGDGIDLEEPTFNDDEWPSVAREDMRLPRTGAESPWTSTCPADAEWPSVVRRDARSPQDGTGSSCRPMLLTTEDEAPGLVEQLSIDSMTLDLSSLESPDQDNRGSPPTIPNWLTAAAASNGEQPNLKVDRPASVPMLPLSSLRSRPNSPSQRSGRSQRSGCSQRSGRSSAREHLQASLIDAQCAMERVSSSESMFMEVEADIIQASELTARMRRAAVHDGGQHDTHSTENAPKVRRRQGSLINERLGALEQASDAKELTLSGFSKSALKPSTPRALARRPTCRVHAKGGLILGRLKALEQASDATELTLSGFSKSALKPATPRALASRPVTERLILGRLKALEQASDATELTLSGFSKSALKPATPRALASRPVTERLILGRLKALEQAGRIESAEVGSVGGAAGSMSGAKSCTFSV